MSPLCLIAAVCLAATAAAAPKEKTRPGPAAHYVIRTSDLNATLSFTSAVLGLRVFAKPLCVPAKPFADICHSAASL